VPAATADAIVKQNEESRLDGLRAAASLLVLLSLVGLLFTRGIPTVQPGSKPTPSPAPP
jgi:hypothetical protein